MTEITSIDPYYDAGTATLSTSSRTMTGAGTQWLANVVPGDQVYGAGGQMGGVVETVVSNTSITLVKNWRGANQTGGVYTIYRVSDSVRVENFSQRLLNLLLGGNISSLGGLGLAANKGLYAVAAGVLGLFDLSVFGRELSGVANAAAGREKLGAHNAANLTAGTVASARLPREVFNPPVSLLSDSGRFAGPTARGITIGAFAFPSYFQTQNGASIGAIGKFIHDNNDYGGTAGALNTYVKDLVDKIRAATYRRHGNEFHVAEVTAGSGTSLEPIIPGGVPHYLAILMAHGPRVPAMTFHAYVRALGATIIMRRYAGQTMAKDGVTSEVNVIISPSDGWVSMTTWDNQDLRSSSGYQPAPFNVYMPLGGRFLLACPALMAGMTQVDDDSGVIAGINRWL